MLCVDIIYLINHTFLLIFAFSFKTILPTNTLADAICKYCCMLNCQQHATDMPKLDVALLLVLPQFHISASDEITSYFPWVNQCKTVKTESWGNIMLSIIVVACMMHMY